MAPIKYIAKFNLKNIVQQITKNYECYFLYHHPGFKQRDQKYLCRNLHIMMLILLHPYNGLFIKQVKGYLLRVFSFYYFCIFYQVQNFKHMQQTNLNAIIERIRRKLNNFTDEDSPTNDKVTHQKTYSSMKKNKKLFQHPNLDKIQCRQSQQIGNRSIVKPEMKSVSTKHIDMMINSPENENIIKRDKNNINNQELLKGSRSCQNIQLDQKKESVSKNISAHIHTETYLSLRKRNKALEDDVKKLKDRLNAIQQNIQKEKVNTNINKSRQKDSRKMNNKYEEKGKRSARTNYFNKSNIEQKNIKKIPITKSSKFIQSKSGYQMKKNNQLGSDKYHKLSKQDAIKHEAGKNNQESQHYITFTDKMLKFELSPGKKLKQKQKCLARCKSSKALAATNACSQQTIKQQKQVNGKLKHNKSSIGESSMSNSSYLRPIEKQKQKQGNRDKRMELNKKANKFSRTKLQ